MNDPVLGDAEIVQIGMSLVVMMAMPYATANGAHIRVDIFDRRIGAWGRFLGDLMARSVGAYILFLLIDKTWDKALDAHEYGDVTNMIEIPVWIAYGAITIGMGGYAIVFVMQLLMQLMSGVRDMSETLIGFLGILTLFFLLVARMPVGMALLAVDSAAYGSLTGACRGRDPLFETYSSITATAFDHSLFVLMGNMAGAAGYSQKLYEAAYAWIGRLKGGLASATVVGYAAFAAVSGSSVPAVTIGKVALPQMKRFDTGMGWRWIGRCWRNARHLIPPSTGPVCDPDRRKHRQAVHRRYSAGYPAVASVRCNNCHYYRHEPHRGPCRAAHNGARQGPVHPAFSAPYRRH